MKVLFVCTGNTCRSPMAAELYKRLFPNHSVSSAGLFADGSAYSEKSAAVLAEIGLELSGASRQIEQDGLECERFFVMTDSHKMALLSIGVSADRITVLNVSDPYGGDITRYRECRNEIMIALGKEVDIVPMNAEDIPAVAEIERECFSSPWSENALLESMQGSTLFWVAKADERVLGYGGVDAVLGEGYVTNIAVSLPYRGFGLGTALTKAMVDYCEQNDFAFITLEVRESNATAISVYEKLGFTKTAIRKNFYTAPKENAVLMTKEFRK